MPGNLAAVEVERLEHRIRAVPGVVACQLGPDVALVLVAPGTDGATVRAAVTALVAEAAASLPVRFLASPAEAPQAGRFRRRSALVLVGSAAALTVGVAAAATLAPLGPGRVLDPGSSSDHRAGSPGPPMPGTGRGRGSARPTTTVDSVVRGGLAAEAVGGPGDAVPAADAHGGGEPDAAEGGTAGAEAPGVGPTGAGTSPVVASAPGRRTSHAARAGATALASDTFSLAPAVHEAAAPLGDPPAVPGTPEAPGHTDGRARPDGPGAHRPALLTIPLPRPVIAAIGSAPPAGLRPLRVPTVAPRSRPGRAAGARGDGLGAGGSGASGDGPGRHRGRALGRR